MRNAAVGRITELAKKDANIIVIAGDLGFGVWDGFRSQFPQRFLNAGICEQAMASIAAGLALEGKKVYLYSIGNFPTLRCIEQIRNDICYHKAAVTVLAVGGGFAYGSLGMSHHATEDLSMMRSLPSMNVFVPADAAEAEGIVEAAWLAHLPCYIRLGKGGEEAVHTGLPDDFALGRACRIREGEDACIFACGPVITEALEAAQRLSGRGISVAIYSFHSIKPIDRKTVQACAAKFSEIITLEEHNRIGGLGSAVAEIIADYGYGTKIRRLGICDTYAEMAGKQSYLRSIYGIDSRAVEEAVSGSWKGQQK